MTEAAWRSARAFFDLPVETKLGVAAGGSPYGYEPIAAEALGRTAVGQRDTEPDPKQTFNLGPPNRGPGSGFGAFERVWPTEPYELRITWLAYYDEMERLATLLLQLFARSMGLGPDRFSSAFDRHLSALRALDYPTSAPSDRSIRAGAHTDYGTLTILRPDPDVGGLEVGDGSGGWLEVPTIDGSFVVNVGDLMHRWTNGRWLSSLHRVVADPGGRRRNSMAFFHNPNWDAAVAPILLDPAEQPLFEPVVAGPWLQAKFEQAAT